MSRTDVATIALRITGIFAWLRAIELIPQLGFWIFERPEGMWGTQAGSFYERLMTLNAATPIALAVVGTLLVILAPRLARWVVGDAAEGEILTGSLVHPALAVTGIVVLIVALPQIGQLVTTLEVLLKQRGEWWTPAQDRAEFEFLIKWLIQMTIGVWLVLKHRSVGRLIARCADTDGGEETTPSA